uniref:Uncharacterized protein n=1 Tax=Romanomermis culicivorax TaxID=13658 RepID=A0A915HTZ5_ROMCU
MFINYEGTFSGGNSNMKQLVVLPKQARDDVWYALQISRLNMKYKLMYSLLFIGIYQSNEDFVTRVDVRPIGYTRQRYALNFEVVFVFFIAFFIFDATGYGANAATNAAADDKLASTVAISGHFDKPNL